MGDPEQAAALTAEQSNELSESQKRLALGFVALMSVLGLSGLALSPYLLVNNPLLLVALSPDGRHLILAAPDLSAWQMLAVGVPRRALALLATYLLARLYGQRALEFAGERMKLVARVAEFLRRALERFGAPLLVVFPTHGLAALAGATGRKMRWFLPPIMLGQVPFILAHFYFGEAIGTLTSKLTALLADNMKLATGIMCGVVILQQILVRVRRKRMEATELAGESAGREVV